MALPNTVGLSNVNYEPTVQDNCHDSSALSMRSLYRSTSTPPRENFMSQPAFMHRLGASARLNPPISVIQRQKMKYHRKFGGFGDMKGEFVYPSGLAVNDQNCIIVADRSNRLVQIFDHEGQFKLEFGKPGRKDGQMLYPSRVAVVRMSGDIVVSEPFPTHQIQIYDRNGRFLRKFGSEILRHPGAIAVDPMGQVIVVECKVMRVIIFGQSGAVYHSFDCSMHLRSPNGVAVNYRGEIFISDSRAHCVKVFNYDGVLLRQIGGDGLTNYPIGVCLNRRGEVLVVSNNGFLNVTVFTQHGQLVGALQSTRTHRPCFDCALMDEDSLIVASEDCHLYVYRYAPLPAPAAPAAPLAPPHGLEVR